MFYVEITTTILLLPNKGVGGDPVEADYLVEFIALLLLLLWSRATSSHACGKLFS